ncbi:hypothetical protein [Burkholderia ambifaria]|uniref:hypothetical protein n=1 Tax=Burkholderia ambifaria TaxID=152480 RepID=UPI001589E9C1|nr:hypothetical protein [Burkholderia ambifaria]
MNDFFKVIDEHDSRVAAERQSAQGAADQAKADAANREMAFASAVEHIVEPLFAEFVAGVKATSREASIKPLSKDGYNRSNIQVGFNVTVGSRLNINASEDSAYSITLMEDGDVEFRSYYDQRVGKNGISKRRGELSSINDETVRHDLNVVLSLALESRKA